MQAFQPLSAILLHHHKLQNLGIGCRMLPTTRLPPRTIFWMFYRYKQLVYFFRLHFVCNAFPSLSPPQTATVNKIPPPGIKERKKEGLLARTWDGRSQHKNKPFSPFRNTYRSQRRGREGEVELLSFLPLSTTGAKIVAGVSGDQRNLVFFPSSSFKPCVSEGGIGFRNRLRGSGLGRRGKKRVAAGAGAVLPWSREATLVPLLLPAPVGRSLHKRRRRRRRRSVPLVAGREAMARESPTSDQ